MEEEERELMFSKQTILRGNTCFTPEAMSEQPKNENNFENNFENNTESEVN